MTQTLWPVICLACAERGAVTRVTASMRHRCGGEVDIYTGHPDQLRLEARAQAFDRFMAAHEQEGVASAPGSNEYAGQMPGPNPMSNHEGKIRCPVCHGSGADIQDSTDPCRECGGDGYITPTTTPQDPQVARHDYPSTQTKVPFMGRRRTAARDDEHPDLAWKRQTFGVVNTSLGRAGYGRHRTAQVTSHSFDDPAGWQDNQSSFNPVRHAIEGARAYASDRGLRDPHPHDFSKVMQTKDRVAAIGRHYDSMPDDDPSAHPHFHAMRDEVAAQHHFATNRMGIKFQTVDHDPYANVHQMVKDVNDNKRLKVMGTHVTGAHPFFSDEENDQFRGVHDLFGHAATGRDFSRHGEEAAFQAHSMMFSHHARPAMAAETRGQNSSLILHGDFQPQKIGVLPRHLHDDSSIDWAPRRAGRREAMVHAVLRTNSGLGRRHAERLVDMTLERFPEVR